MANNNKNSYARNRKLKKIGILAASISAGIIAVVSLIAFLPRTNEGFSVQIDSPEVESHFVMQETLDGASTTRLGGAPLRTQYTTSAKTVEDYLKNFNVDSLHGSNNYQIDDNSGNNNKGVALVYTVYLKNVSTSQAQEFGFYVNLDNYKHLTADSNPLSYMRIIIDHSIVENDKSLDHERSVTYYGQRHTKGMATYAGDDDFRECVSSFTRAASPTSGKSVRKPNTKESDEPETIIASGQEYCVEFNEAERIVTENKVVIPAGKTMRFTFVSYLEGYDPDSYVDRPVKAELLTTLHFGI